MSVLPGILIGLTGLFITTKRVLNEENMKMRKGSKQGVEETITIWIRGVNDMAESGTMKKRIFWFEELL